MVGRYKVDAEVDRGDFGRSGWSDAITAAKNGGYSAMSSALANAAKLAADEGGDRTAKVLWLLAEACSPLLKSTSSHEPFVPLFVGADGQRSVIPDDFTSADLEFFDRIVGDIGDPRLQGRVADILWTCRKPKSPEYARIAIDAYRSLPLDLGCWTCDGQECWSRAAYLATLIRDAAGTRLQSISDAMWSVCTESDCDKVHLILGVSETLINQSLLSSTRRLELSRHLEDLCEKMPQEEDRHVHRRLLVQSITLSESCGAPERTADLYVKLAEQWASEADSQSAGALAASNLERAIQILRRVPRALREDRRVTSRMEELRSLLTKANERASEEGQPFHSDEFDIRTHVDRARASVHGKTLLDALGAFCQFYRASEKDLRRSALEWIEKYPLQHLFGTVVLGDGGRVVAKVPGADIGSDSGSQGEGVVWNAMMRSYLLAVQFVVNAYVVPSLEVITQEHRVRDFDVRSLTVSASIVPPDRAWIVARGLIAGFERDYATAIHILAPQVENVVRFHLKNAGDITTSLDKAGIENEKGLSALVDSDTMATVFGKDLAFEIRALFCDPLGPNLRNAVAHGLIGGAGYSRPEFVYGWWFCLRLVTASFWNAHRPAPPDLEEPDE